MTAGSSDAARRYRPDASARLAELEAEVSALRRALARADFRAGRAASARSAQVEIEARHGRDMASGRADLAAERAENDALRRANAELAASRAALREREERLRLILASATDYAIFTMDLDRRVTSWNEGAERLLGWTEDEIVGRPADVIFTPEDRAGGAPDEESEGALRDGRAADERWHQRKDGTRFWANGLMLPMRDPAAGAAAPPLGLLKVMRDETGKRRAEEELRAGKARWRGLFERMHEGFALCEMVYGPDGKAVDYRHLELNRAWGRLTGVPVKAVQGRLVSEAIPGIEPFWLKTYARVVETGEPAHFEHHLAVYGRWFEVMAYRTEPGRFAAVFSNITERKAAEARRDALVELGDRLRDLRDPGEIASTAAEVIGRALGAVRAGYGAVDADEDGIRIERDLTGGPSAGSVAGSHRLSDFWEAPFTDDLRRGGVVAIGDVSRDPRTAPHAARFAALGIRACVYAAAVEAGRVAALLFVNDAAPRDWSAEEIAFVRGAADRAWAAVGRARAEGRLRGSEGHRRAALTAARLGTWEWDLATDAVTLDDRAREVFGFRPGEGARAPEVFGRIHPHDSARVHAEARAAADALSRLETEYRIRLPDGSVRAVASLGDTLPGSDGRPGRMLGVFADITERKMDEDRRALLVNEVNHRAKNALAVVQAMLRLTKADDVPSFVRSVEGRVSALARAHTLLASQEWAGSSLHDLVRGELAPFLAGRATIDGPAVTLPAVAAQPVAMVLHELATNAAKHGALSAETGTVAVAWRVEGRVEGRDLRIRWTERGGPPIDGAPERSGFGSRLLNGTIRTQLGGTVERTWDAPGLVCDVVIPLA